MSDEKSFFKRMFGSGKKGDKEPTPQEAIQRLREIEGMLVKKSEFLEMKVDSELAIAKKNGTKNKRVALQALKRKKRYEKQLQQIDGTLSTIELQRECLENASTNTQVLTAMGTAAKALKKAHNNLNILMAEVLRISIGEDGIAIVYMQNGENRFNITFLDAWNKILDEIDRNTSIRGLIITGTDKYFSLGLDLTFFQTLTPERVQQARVEIGRLIKRITHLPIPTVAALNGHAYGAGAFLALSCDYRVMRSDRGFMCFPEVSLGMRIQYTNLALLRLKIPKGRSLRDAILFGKAMKAEEACSMQIVDVISVKDSVIIDAKSLIVEALGKRGIARKALGDMKKDVYVLPDVPDSQTAALPKL